MELYLLTLKIVWTIHDIKSLYNTWLYKDPLKIKREALSKFSYNSDTQWSLLMSFRPKITPLLTLFYPMAISKSKSSINKLKKFKSKSMMKTNHTWLNKHPIKKRLRLKNHHNLKIKTKTQTKQNNKILKLNNKPKRVKLKLIKQKLLKKKRRKLLSNKKL